jgi:hypothetical protein
MQVVRQSWTYQVDRCAACYPRFRGKGKEPVEVLVIDQIEKPRGINAYAPPSRKSPSRHVQLVLAGNAGFCSRFRTIL